MSRRVSSLSVIAFLLLTSLSLVSPVQGADVVHVLVLRGTVEQGVAAYLCRGVREAEAKDVPVLVEINTFGGRVDAATEARDCLLQATVPVYTFVTERAWSAGALIALTGRQIVMAPGSSMGAAEPRPNDEKTVSAIRAEFASTAEKYGRDPKIAEAMVDARIAIPGVVDKGEILTLRAAEAKRIHYADLLAATQDEVVRALYPAGTSVVIISMNWAEKVARFLTDPIVSSVLLTLAFLGLLAEFLSPGWGLPGITAAIALGLFFGGRLVVGLVGWEVVLVFLAGLALLLVEVFAIPGFGVVGGLGLLGIFASLFFSYPTPAIALRSLSATIIATTVLGALLIRLFWRRNGHLRRLILATRQARQEGYSAVATNRSDLVGIEGIALTALRPAGAIDIGGQRVDAVSEGPLISAGSRVRVIRAEGICVTVKAISDSGQG